MFNMVDDGFIHFHAADGNRLADDQTAQRHDCHFRRSTADIHHHAAFRLKDGQACANRRRQRLFNQVDLLQPARANRRCQRFAVHFVNF